jgi:hypothetical protein
MKGVAAACVVLVMAAVLGGAVAGAGAEADGQQAEPGLEQRVDRLEADLSRLKGAAESEKPAMRSKYAVDLYGFLKLDLAYMDSRANDAGNYARWIESEQDNRNDNQFNITARESRFGLMLKGPDVRSMKTSGRVEVDFYEGGAENKNRPMMRHAYLQVEWPESGWSILAGQTSDVVSPLVPETLNYSVGWWIGNIGYRRPQLRVSKSFDAGSGVGVLLQAAVARTIGHFGAFSPSQDSGKDAGFPTVQGRYAMSFPLFGAEKFTAGVSGHWAEEEYDRDAEGRHTHLQSWSVNLDFSVPIARWLSFRGEVWGGENLDQYLGGVGQGVVIETTEGEFVNGENIKGAFVRQWSVASVGGWGCFICGPWDGWRFNFGYSVDNPRDRDVVSGQGRTWNNSYWGQVSYDLNEAVRAGVELSWWETAYKNQEDGDALRLQISFVYRF